MYIDEKFIKDRIVQLRTQKGVSARDMSLSIGQNKNYINIIENGGNLPSMNGLILICEYFGITLKEFFDTENTSPNDLNELINEVKSFALFIYQPLCDTSSKFESIFIFFIRLSNSSGVIDCCPSDKAFCGLL